MFEADWALAAPAHELERFLQKSDGHAAEREGYLDRQFAEASVIEDVREVLFTHRRVIYGSFDYYSVLSSEAQGRASEQQHTDIGIHEDQTGGPG